MYCKHEAAFEQHQRDMVSLEALHTQLEQAQQFGSIDKPTQQLTALAYNKITSRYSDYGIESFEGDTVSLEKSDNVLARMAKGVGKMLAAIWKKIMDFFRWIGRLFGFKAKSKKQVAASVTSDIKKVKETKVPSTMPSGGMSAAAHRSASDAGNEQAPTEEANTVEIAFAAIESLGAIADDIDKSNKEEAESKKSNVKTYKPIELEDLKKIFNMPKVDGRVSIGSAGSVFGKEAMKYDGEGMLRAMDKALGVPHSLRVDVINTLSILQSALEFFVSNPNVDIGNVTDSKQLELKNKAMKTITSVRNTIHAYSGRLSDFGRTNYSGFPGLKIQYSGGDTAMGDLSPAKLESWYGSSSLKVTRVVEQSKETLTFAMISMPQLEKFTNQMANDQLEIYDINNKYTKALEQPDPLMKKVQADEALSQNPYIKWLCGWVTKITRSVSTADTFLLGIDKAAEKYFATCVDVLTDKPIQNKKEVKNKPYNPNRNKRGR